jgi:hypothetical protein
MFLKPDQQLQNINIHCSKCDNRIKNVNVQMLKNVCTSLQVQL